MRILSLDPGSKRIGVAVSDELRLFAQPVGFLEAEPVDAFLDQLKKLIQGKQVSLIVVGMPRNMDGTYGPAALKVREFVAALQVAVTVPIKTWDERLTSAQANRLLAESHVKPSKRREKVDQTAAALLLQNYLDATAA